MKYVIWVLLFTVTLLAKAPIAPAFVMQNSQIAESYNLSQNYPNPFNPSTVINYTIPFESNVNLTVYNAIGEKVKDLFSGTKQPGNYKLNFDGSDLSSGVYYYVLTAQTMYGKQSFHSVKKMLLLK
jgi:hypothetical protein